MDPNYLLFTKVVELGSLSAAGRALGISPAMMSKRLARLEERLGVLLLRRSTRKLALTAQGARFYEDVVRILRCVEEAEDRVTSVLREPSGPLRVSAPTSFGRLHVAPHLADFINANPKVELQFDLSDSYADLLTDQVDVAIRIASDHPASLAVHHLVENRRILCASPAYLTKHGAPRELEDLARHRLIAASGQSPWRLANKRARRAIEVKSCVATNSSEIVRELVLTGVGIALRSMWDVESFLASGELVQVLPQWVGPSDLGVYAVHLRAAGQSAAIDAFVDFLKGIFQDQDVAAHDKR